MTWPTLDEDRRIELSHIGDFAPVYVLYEFDGPCIFTTFSASHSLLLAYLAEDLDDQEVLRFIVSSTSASTIGELKNGTISVREALTRGSMWIVDSDYSYRPKSAYHVQCNELPEDALPARGTMLWASLEPAFRVRLKGDEVQPGRVPASVLAQAASIASKALKPVFEWAARDLRSDISGRPPDWLRLLYSLETQCVSYGSLEIGFRTAEVPDHGQLSFPLEGDDLTPERIQSAGWTALQEGLEWAISKNPLPNQPNDKWLAILESLKGLSPISKGPVDSIEVSGGLLDRVDNPFQLDRQASKRIRDELTKLKRAHKVESRMFQGRIRELDLDKLTMILRDVRGESSDIALVLWDEELLDIAREAHYQESEVGVVVVSSDVKTWTAVGIGFVEGSSNN